MTPIVIDDPDDPRLDPYRAIRERDLVRRDGRFVAEGTTVLNVLARQRRFPTDSALILENRLAGVREMLAKLPADVPVYTAGRLVMDHVAGFPIHRGVLAIGRRPADVDQPPSADHATNWRTVVALSGLSNHDNVGAIFRNAVALGADAVLMDRATCDPLYRKALRVSVGGVLALPWHRFATVAAMLDWLEENDFELAGLSPHGARSIRDWQPARRTALVLGAEGAGLDPSTLARMHTLRIDMARRFDSLNVATSAALALHHLQARLGG